MTGKPQANDVKHEFLALMERAESASRNVSDYTGALEAKLARVGIDAALTAIEDELARGTDPAMIINARIINALARGFGIPLAAALASVTQPGRTRQALELVLPALLDIARAFADTQDKRAIEQQQGRLSS